MYTEQEKEPSDYSVLVCSECLRFTCEHREDKPCEGGEIKLHTFADRKDHEAKSLKAKTYQLEKRAEVAVTILRNVNDREAAVRGLDHMQHCATLRAMMHTAWLLGGESLESFVRCVETLVRFKAILHYDSAMLSLCWTGAGMHGGFIFHSSDRTWGIHT